MANKSSKKEHITRSKKKDTIKTTRNKGKVTKIADLPKYKAPKKKKKRKGGMMANVSKMLKG